MLIYYTETAQKPSRAVPIWWESSERGEAGRNYKQKWKRQDSSTATVRKGKRRPQRAARRPGPNGDRAGTALRAGRTWRLAAPTTGLCAGAPPRRLLPPRLPHRRSPARGRLQTAGHGGARRGRGGPPEAGRAASGTRRVPSGERARAPQVKKSPPRSLCARRRKAGTSLSAERGPGGRPRDTPSGPAALRRPFPGAGAPRPRGGGAARP